MVSNGDMDFLVDLAKQIQSRPGWAPFASFWELRGRGQRTEALKQLKLFLDQATRWAFEARLELVEYVLEKSECVADRNVFLPQPLRMSLVVPTLHEWSEESPQDARPHLWLGLLRCDGASAHLEKALALDPCCGQARKTLVEWMLGDVEYNQHELPAFYIHNPREDLRELDRAEMLVDGIASDRWVEMVKVEISDLRARAKEWIAGHRAEDDFATH